MPDGFDDLAASRDRQDAGVLEGGAGVGEWAAAMASFGEGFVEVLPGRWGIGGLGWHGGEGGVVVWVWLAAVGGRLMSPGSNSGGGQQSPGRGERRAYASWMLQKEGSRWKERGQDGQFACGKRALAPSHSFPGGACEEVASPVPFRTFTCLEASTIRPPITTSAAGRGVSRSEGISELQHLRLTLVNGRPAPGLVKIEESRISLDGILGLHGS